MPLRFLIRASVSVIVLAIGFPFTALAQHGHELATDTCVVHVEGYPTTLFLDRSHRIVKAHSGFDGPSTGARFAAQKKELEEALKAILAR